MDWEPALCIASENFGSDVKTVLSFYICYKASSIHTVWNDSVNQGCDLIHPLYTVVLYMQVLLVTLRMLITIVSKNYQRRHT